MSDDRPKKTRRPEGVRERVLKWCPDGSAQEVPYQTTFGVRDITHIYSTAGHYRIQCITQVVVVYVSALRLIAQRVVDRATEYNLTATRVDDEDFRGTLYTQ